MVEVRPGVLRPAVERRVLATSAYDTAGNYEEHLECGHVLQVWHKEPRRAVAGCGQCTLESEGAQ
jgi:hypothetical protein